MEEIAPLSLRLATPADARVVTGLLTISYSRVLAADYDASQLRAILPSVIHADARLLGAGRYYLVWSGEQAIGCGGWSRRGQAVARLHYFATHPSWLRMGVGRMVMEACLSAAGAEGAGFCTCSATIGAIPFYRSFGFSETGRGMIRLRDGLGFPVAEMVLNLRK